MSDADHVVNRYRRRARLGRKLREAACIVLLYITLMIVAVLAIPTGILAGLIGAVLVAMDRVMGALE